jgi:glutamyl-tRNA reductase
MRGAPLSSPPQVMSSIGSVGIDHRTAGIRPLGFAWLSSERLERTLGPLAETGAVDELLLVSPAGGIEAYFAARDPGAAADALGEAMVALVGTEPGVASRLRDRLVCRLGPDAVRRMFRVVAGVEAPVPGDDEVRRALRAAERAGTAGPVLRRLCDEALRSARRARQCADLGAGPEQVARLVDAGARRFDAGGEPARFEVIDGQTADHDPDPPPPRGREEQD